MADGADPVLTAARRVHGHSVMVPTLPKFDVREAASTDRPSILELVRIAFAAADHDSREEVDIVNGVWAAGASRPGFELVATTKLGIVGHVLASVGHLSGRPAIGIAPLCVLPGCQCRGIGSRLMTELLDRIDRAGWPFALLLGDPAYYRRFGFGVASLYGISYPPVGQDDPHFMIRPFGATALIAVQGEYRYSWEPDKN